MKRKLLMTLLAAGGLVFWPVSGAAAEDRNGHEEQGREERADHDEHAHKDDSLHLDAGERRAAGIRLGRVEMRALAARIRLPAEVIPNAYRSAKVATRVTAQVERRHARLGDKVEAGAPLLTLTSVDMAEAQGALLLADREWQRVRALGTEVVSQRRYTEAEVVRQQALARVIAYGMTRQQAESMLGKTDAADASGRFDLFAPISGTVTTDEFVVGELIEPGRVLFDINDESLLWVEAKAPPDLAASVRNGMTGHVGRDGGRREAARVVQVHHTLDEATRTQAIRLEVPNEDDWLHPGEFVEVDLAIGDERATPAVPARAISHIRGRPAVFAFHDDEFHLVHVETGVTAGGWVELTGDFDAGGQLAVDGVFHLKSLLLKGEMGEGHVH